MAMRSEPTRTGRRLAAKIAACILVLLTAATAMVASDRNAFGMVQSLPWMTPMPSGAHGRRVAAAALKGQLGARGRSRSQRDRPIDDWASPRRPSGVGRLIRRRPPSPYPDSVRRALRQQARRTRFFSSLEGLDQTERKSSPISHRMQQSELRFEMGTKSCSAAEQPGILGCTPTSLSPEERSSRRCAIATSPRRSIGSATHSGSQATSW